MSLPRKSTRNGTRGYAHLVKIDVPVARVWRALTEPGLDLTLRKSADSWVKLQTGKSDGLVSGSFYSNDGGYGFTNYNPNAFANASANAYRADLSLGLSDFLSGNKGRLTYYSQHLDAGYSAPGFDSLTATDYYGGAFKLPIGRPWSPNAQAGRKAQEQAPTTTPPGPRVAHQKKKKLSRRNRPPPGRPPDHP